MKRTSLVNDKAFKMVMDKDDPVSRKALAELLGAIIGKKVQKIETINKELKDTYWQEKDTLQDIVVKFNDGDYANIEMQVVKNLYVEGRLFYYLAKMIMAQPLKGKEYIIKPVYEIMLLDDIIYNDEELFHHFVSKSQTGHEMKIGNIVLVEMKKVNELNYDTNELNRWIYYIRNCDNHEKRDIIKKILDKSEGIRMANQLYNEISKEEWEYLYNAFKDKEEVSWKFALGASKEEGRVEGKEEGRIEGKEEGREEERQESVKKMASLLKKMGVSLEDCLLNIKEEYSQVDSSIIENIVKEVFE